MFRTLLESRAIRQRHTGGSIVSVLFHSAIITAGVIATTRDLVTSIPEPPAPRVIPYVRTVDPHPAPARRTPSLSTASLVSIPSVPRLDIPTIVPVGIPPVDLTGTPTPIDFSPGPVGKSGLLCEQDCAQSAPMDASGNQLWNARELMMRLLEEPVPPHYPESLRRAGVEGEVVVKFVVDTTGRVDMRSIEILKSTHGAFSTAVRETISRLRFAPATSGERKIPALAVMPFHFTLR
jgi:protein TonB